MERKNCWEVKECGREPEGKKVEELGVCPAALQNNFDGVNNGKYGGRFCWVVAGTFCDGEPGGTFAQKLLDCIHCNFLKKVNIEEGREFILTPSKIKNDKI